MEKEISILIVEDEIIIAKDIEQTLIRNGFKSVLLATNYQKAKKIIAGKRPELVLCDINLRSTKDGIDLMEEVNETQTIPFVFITAYSDFETIKRIQKNNAFYYITKPFTEKQLISTILLAEIDIKEQTLINITKREQEVISLLGKGYSTKKIAEKLIISFNTVETHRKNMMKKCKCKNTAELVFLATSRKWI